MSRRIDIAFLCVVALGTPSLAAADRPNIVLILADDLGWGDVGCYNPASKIPTPNIDRLAAQGMRFTDAHAPTSVCSPTRYAILTGRYCWRSRLKRGVLWTYAMPLIEPDRLTLPAMLKQHGFTTGCIGKWHLGMQWARKDGKTSPPNTDRLPDEVIDLTRPITAGPLTAGFDSYFGTAVPNFPPYCFIEDDHILGPVPDRPKPKSVYGNPGRMQKGWRLDRILPELTARSVAFIETHASAEPKHPFFLYNPLTAPHTPIAPSAPFRGKSEAMAYGDFVVEVDHHVGQVLKALEDAGVAGDTLVFFTSDNGSPARNGVGMGGPVGSVVTGSGHHPSGPWRGLKSDIHEGGHRVPFIAKWPGKIRANVASDEPICHVDLMATVAAIVGHELPADAAEDSYDLLPVLLREDLGHPLREAIVHHSGSGMFAIRQGNWKLVLGRGSGGFTRPARVKPGPGEAPGQLYDLRDDPAETRNRYLERPEVVARLSALLERYQRSGRSAPRVAAGAGAPR